MRERGYLENPYQRTWTAQIVEQTRAGDRPAVVLDRTLFYPSSGGQPHDIGTINGVRIADVFEDEGGRVVHVLEAMLEGSRAECELDWERRFDHMQQHTGQHILSQAFLQACGADTLSFHLGRERATIDVDRGDLGREAVLRAEVLANRVVFEDRRVTAHVVERPELHRYSLRKPPTVEGPVRILGIEGFDLSPCGGTHCARTGEIGMIKVLRHESYKGGTRIHFVCGGRALRDYRNKVEVIEALSRATSAAESELLERVSQREDAFKAMRAERERLQEALLEQEALLLIRECATHSGFRLIQKTFPDRDPKEMKRLAGHLAGAGEDLVVFLGTSSPKAARLLFQCSEGLDLDVRPFLEAACGVLQGRGGGRPHQAQGGGPAVDRLEGALEKARDGLMRAMQQVRPG